MNLLPRIATAAVIAGFVFLACLLLGSLLGTVGIPPVEAVGHFLKEWAAAIAVLMFLWALFRGWVLP